LQKGAEGVVAKRKLATYEPEVLGLTDPKFSFGPSDIPGKQNKENR
jgi:hypothetical protein